MSTQETGVIETVLLTEKATGAVYMKLTTELLVNGKFASTLWCPQDGADEYRIRQVNEFETCASALIDMYRNAVSGFAINQERFGLKVKAG